MSRCQPRHHLIDYELQDMYVYSKVTVAVQHADRQAPHCGCQQQLQEVASSKDLSQGEKAHPAVGGWGCKYCSVSLDDPYSTPSNINTWQRFTRPANQTVLQQAVRGVAVDIPGATQLLQQLFMTLLRVPLAQLHAHKLNTNKGFGESLNPLHACCQESHPQGFLCC